MPCRLQSSNRSARWRADLGSSHCRNSRSPPKLPKKAIRRVGPNALQQVQAHGAPCSNNCFPHAWCALPFWTTLSSKVIHLHGSGSPHTMRPTLSRNQKGYSPSYNTPKNICCELLHPQTGQMLRTKSKLHRGEARHPPQPKEEEGEGDMPNMHCRCNVGFYIASLKKNKETPRLSLPSQAFKLAGD